jgi:hypothetical protein
MIILAFSKGTLTLAKFAVLLLPKTHAFVVKSFRSTVSATTEDLSCLLLHLLGVVVTTNLMTVASVFAARNAVIFANVNNI